ncbi:glucose-1-phosphate adenylyltransferase [bacterium]|nr:glucose-1-phosphate adenylyltransferase [bacterium]
MRDVLAVILGGGRGTRLYPLTKYRSKPAVPIAGKYRLIDIPISNCLNSNISRIFILTQFNSASLNRHVNLTYHFDTFRREGFVNILAAEQRMDNMDWFQGTADAVRKTLMHYEPYEFKYYLILSGDHIYSMDYRKMIAEHALSGADATVAALPVTRDKVSGLGILEIKDDGTIDRFVEKPKKPEVIDTLKLSNKYWEIRGEKERSEELFLANMGVYIFNREVLDEILSTGEELDFGSEIFPRTVVETDRVHAFPFEGYWEDVGTIRSFYEAHLGFLERVPKFSFYDEYNRVYSHARYLPPSKLNHAHTEKAILAEGSIVDDANIKQTFVGLRSIVGRGTTLNSVIMMGADFYETVEDRKQNQLEQKPHVGIGENCYLEGVIIDKNARIGNNVRIMNGDVVDQEGEGWMVRDGIVVIEKNAIIKDGTDLNFR